MPVQSFEMRLNLGDGLSSYSEWFYIYFSAIQSAHHYFVALQNWLQNLSYLKYSYHIYADCRNTPKSISPLYVHYIALHAVKICHRVRKQ